MWWSMPAPDTTSSDRVIVVNESHQGAVTCKLLRLVWISPRPCFKFYGIDAGEKVVVRKQLRRSQMLAFFEALPPASVGMEACASSHCWARELTKLGHQVRLMPAKDVEGLRQAQQERCRRRRSNL